MADVNKYYEYLAGQNVRREVEGLLTYMTVGQLVVLKEYIEANLPPLTDDEILAQREESNG